MTTKNVTGIAQIIKYWQCCGMPLNHSDSMSQAKKTHAPPPLQMSPQSALDMRHQSSQPQKKMKLQEIQFLIAMLNGHGYFGSEAQGINVIKKVQGDIQAWSQSPEMYLTLLNRVLETLQQSHQNEIPDPMNLPSINNLSRSLYRSLAGSVSPDNINARLDKKALHLKHSLIMTNAGKPYWLLNSKSNLVQEPPTVEQLFSRLQTLMATNSMTLQTSNHGKKTKAILGSGNFGMVRPAWDIRNHCEVAVKKIRSVDDNLLSRGQIADLFHAEKDSGTTILRLFSPHEQKAFTFVSDGALSVGSNTKTKGYLFSPLRYGGNGEERVSQMLMDPATTPVDFVRFAQQICQHVNVVQKKGFVHSDLKLANIIDGTLADIPDLKRFNQQNPVTSVYQLLTLKNTIYSPRYIPPEAYIFHKKPTMKSKTQLELLLTQLNNTDLNIIFQGFNRFGTGMMLYELAGRSTASLKKPKQPRPDTMVPIWLITQKGKSAIYTHLPRGFDNQMIGEFKQRQADKMQQNKFKKATMLTIAGIGAQLAHVNPFQRISLEEALKQLSELEHDLNGR